MGRKVAKELIHIQGWLNRVDEVVERGKTPTSPTTCCRGRRLADDEAGRGTLFHAAEATISEESDGD